MFFDGSKAEKRCFFLFFGSFRPVFRHMFCAYVPKRGQEGLESMRKWPFECRKPFWNGWRSLSKYFKVFVFFLHFKKGVLGVRKRGVCNRSGAWSCAWFVGLWHRVMSPVSLGRFYHIWGAMRLPSFPAVFHGMRSLRLSSSDYRKTGVRSGSFWYDNRHKSLKRLLQKAEKEEKPVENTPRNGKRGR